MNIWPSLPVGRHEITKVERQRLLTSTQKIESIRTNSQGVDPFRETLKSAGQLKTWFIVLKTKMIWSTSMLGNQRYGVFVRHEARFEFILNYRWTSSRKKEDEVRRYSDITRALRAMRNFFSRYYYCHEITVSFVLTDSTWVSPLGWTILDFNYNCSQSALAVWIVSQHCCIDNKRMTTYLDNKAQCDHKSSDNALIWVQFASYRIYGLSC